MIPSSFVPDTPIVAPSPAPTQGALPSSFQPDQSIVIDDAKTMLGKSFSGTIQGVQQFGEGFQQTKEGVKSKNVGLVGRGILNELAGGINTAFSPVTNVINTAGGLPIPGTGETVGSATQKYGIQPKADIIAKIPALQKLMANYPNADELVGNIITLATPFILGGGEKGAIPETPIVEPKAPGAIPEVAPKTPTIPPETQNVINTRTQGLQGVADRYVSVSNAVDAAKGKGFSPLEDIASDDRFIPEIDKSGTIDASKAIKNLNDYVKPIAQAERAAIEAEGKSVSYDAFQKSVFDELNSSSLRERGASYDTIQSRVAKDLEVYKREFAKEGTIDLTKLDDIKDAKYRIANWNNEDAQIADKIVARAARETIINNVENADIKALNDKMSQYYSARDVLDAMDNKKVQGGRLGTYFARTIGSIVGSHFGPLGGIVGAGAGDLIQGAMMKGKFGPQNAGINLEAPEILKSTKESLSTPPLQLKSQNPVSQSIQTKQ